MTNNRCMSKFGTWIPFLLVSTICIVVPIVAGVSYVDVLIGYGCATGTLILLTTLMGIRFKRGLIAASVESKRRLDGQWAIVTGANRYVSPLITSYYHGECSTSKIMINFIFKLWLQLQLTDVVIQFICLLQLITNGCLCFDSNI